MFRWLRQLPLPKKLVNCPLPSSNSARSRAASSALGGLAAAAVGAGWMQYTSNVRNAPASKEEKVEVPLGWKPASQLFVTASERFQNSCKSYEEHRNLQGALTAIDAVGLISGLYLSRFLRTHNPSFCVRAGVSAIAIGAYAVLGIDAYRHLKDMKERREWHLHFVQNEVERKGRAVPGTHTFGLQGGGQTKENLYVVPISESIRGVADRVSKNKDVEEARIEIDDGDSAKPLSISYNYKTKKYRAKLFGESEERADIENITVQDVLRYGYLWEINVWVRRKGDIEWRKVLPNKSEVESKKQSEEEMILNLPGSPKRYFKKA